MILEIHGGPFAAYGPHFAAEIQLFAAAGYVVVYANPRGSTGYGFEYMHHVEKDWGGADRLDHVHALTEVLAKDERLDVSRAAVVGRSYGGFMTLTLPNCLRTSAMNSSDPAP